MPEAKPEKKNELNLLKIITIAVVIAIPFLLLKDRITQLFDGIGSGGVTGDLPDTSGDGNGGGDGGNGGGNSADGGSNTYTPIIQVTGDIIYAGEEEVGEQNVWVNVSGDTLQGDLNFQGNFISNLGDAINPGDALNLATADGRYVATGASFSGDVIGTYDALLIAADVIGDSEIDFGQVTLSDFTNDGGFYQTSTDSFLYNTGDTSSGTFNLNDNDGVSDDVNLVIGDGDETGDLIIGTVGLNDVGSGPTNSGASLVGVFDEFTNSNATNLQDILDDLDAAIVGGSSGDITSVTAGSGLTGGGLTGDVTLDIGAGNGISVAADAISINSPTCAGTDKLQWNGTAFVCSSDVDTNTTYSAGNGLTLGGTTFSLGNLTSDWNQGGAFDIVLNHASSELKILESTGGLYYGIFEVGDLAAADATYTFSGTSGTVLTSANYASTLDPAYIQFHPSSAQVSGNTSNSLIWLNENGTGTPNVLELEVGGNDVFSVANTGDVRIWGDLTVDGDDTGYETVNIGDLTVRSDDTNDGRIFLNGEQTGVVTTSTIINSGINLQIISGGTSNIQLTSGGNIVEVIDGDTFRIRDSANSDYVAFSHDGTDFNIVGTNTTDINITGASLALQADNEYLRIGAGNDIEFYHDGTNSYIDNNTGILNMITAGNLNLQPDNDTDDYIYLDTTTNETGLYWEGVNAFTNDPGIKIDSASGKLQFRDNDSVTWINFDYRGNRMTRLLPEYEGAVLNADGSNNTGAMTSDTEVHGNYKYNHYEWSSSQGTIQDYDIYVKWQVPNDFTGFQTGTNDALIVDIATETTDNTQNKVDVYLYEDGSATSATSDLTNVSGTAADWQTDQEGNAVVVFDDSDTILSGLVAGDVLIVRIIPYSHSNNYARVGAITLNWKTN